MTAHARVGGARQDKSRAESIARVAETLAKDGVLGDSKFRATFPILIEATGGAEGARALILHLAIRGLLVEQSSSAVNSRAVRQEMAGPFELPPHWEWKRVDQVGEVKLGRQRAPQNHNGPHMRPYLRVANVFEARIDTTDVLEMNFEPEEVERFLLASGDVLLNEGQSYELVGRPAIYRGEVPGACFQNTLIRFRPAKTVSSEFSLVVFRAYMRTGRFRKEAQQTTNIAHLSAGRLSAIEFPVPPLAEQKRIVARVDQLMALIDELEAKQNRKREIGARFTKASLEALTTAEGPEEFDTAWKRVVENWGVVVDRAEKVTQVKRMVLHLAVRGLLVEQKCSDTARTDPAEQVARERNELLNGKRMSGRGHDESENEDFAAPYNVPDAWQWFRLGEVAGHIVDGTHHTPKYVERGVDFISAKNIKNGNIEFDGCRQIDQAEFDELAKRCRPKRGDVLITKSGSIGDVAVVKTDRVFTLFESVALVPLIKSIDPDFASYVIYLEASGQFGELKRKGMAVQHLHLVDIRTLPFPLPPLDEQKRIVAKVDHLMKLCDELEAKLRRAEDRASKLVEAVVGEMVG